MGLNSKFSFELLPPLKGNSVKKVYDVIDRLREFNPAGINITSHHGEYIYKEQADGTHRRIATVKRPGTVAIAAAIQNKYDINAVPHLICRGFTREETEYALLDLNFLGIENIFLVQGDSKQKEIPGYQGECNLHATDLQRQVNDFNRGIGLEDMHIQGIETPFKYGMACYPEKHEEAPNMASDIKYAKMKVDNGASYLVTQMFFDNAKYFDFVKRCREANIFVPIVPGIKPLLVRSQLNVLPRVFRVDLPEPLVEAVESARDEADIRRLGIEWCINQCRELLASGVPRLHFYTHHATDAVYQVAKEIY